MSAILSGTLRTVAFGEFDAALWGCVWANGDSCVAVGGRRESPSLALGGLALHGVAASEHWTVAGAGVELEVVPHGETADADAVGGFDQMCRVSGTIRLADGEHELDVLGRRALRGGLDLARIGAVRDLSAWFAPDEGAALTALRPRGTKGHDRDAIVASVFEGAGARGVADPRLSSTYRGDGELLHAGLELWLDAENDQQYPYRAAADAIEAGTRVAGDGRSVTVWPLLCRARGQVGFGVYVLAENER